MPRYQVIDPTGEGFFQVADVSNQSAPFKKPILNDDGIEIEIEACQPIDRSKPMVLVVASFTPYCACAEFEAASLCDRLNAREGFASTRVTGLHL